jgi:hypothetical protein
MPQIGHGVAGDPATEVHIRIYVTERQRPWCGEHRLSAVQPGISRTADRAPSAAVPIHEQHVIEFVDGFERHHQRRPSMMLEDHRCCERCFEAVGGVVSDHSSKRALGGAFGRRFRVVRQRVEKALDAGRCTDALQDPSLGWCESRQRRRDRGDGLGGPGVRHRA